MDDITQKTNGSLSHGFSSQASSLTSTTKYGGLIDIPIHKQIRNSMVVVKAHFDQVTPSLFAMHFIISLFRFAQFLGPAFLVCDKKLYTDGSAAYNTIHYVSILYRFIPVGMNLSVLTIGLFLYSGISLLFCLVFLLSSLYYRKAAKLPDVISYALSIYISTLGYLLQPFCGSLIGEAIGELIITPPSDYYKPIIAIVLAIIFCAIHVSLESAVLAHNINFKPDSIQFVSGNNALYFELFTILINVVLTAAIKLYIIPKLVLILISFVLYVLAAYYVTAGASFVKPQQQSYFAGYCIAAILVLLFAVILIAARIPGDMIFLIGSLVISCICQVVGTFLTNRTNNNHLMFLDELEDKEPESIKMSVKKFLMNIVTGFQASHPVCISFKVFEIGLTYFPDNTDIMSVFAKFIAIYPECTKRLAAIQNKLGAVGIHSNAARQLAHQIISIIDQRENVVNMSLKKKLNNAQKKLNAAKRKIQNIWDFIIQSNLPELGPAISTAYKSTNIAELEIIKLKRAYPNNTFVARIYLRFLVEVKRDLTAANTEQETIKLLRKGLLAIPDKPNELGITAFPNLPHVTNVTNTEKLINTESYTESEIGMEDEQAVSEIEANVLMQGKINSLRLPTITKTIITSICVCFIAAILPIIIMLALNNYYVESIYEPVIHMKAISALRALNFQISAMMIRVAMEELTHKFDPVFPPNWTPVNLNNSLKTRDHMAIFVTTAGEITAKVNDMRNFRRDNANMNKVRDILFTNSIPFMYYKNSTSYNDMKMSGVNIMIDTALQGSRFLTINPITESIIEQTEFLNPRLNAEVTGTRLSEALVIFDTFVKNQCNNVQSILLYVQIAYSIFIALVYIALIWHSLVNTQKETNEVYVALTMLPKNVVSHAADSIRIIKKESSSNTESTSMQESNKQEETIIKVFMSANESSSGNTAMNAVQVVAAIIATGCSIVAVNLLCILYSNQYDTLLTNAPHLDYIMGTSAYMYGALINIYSIALSQSFKPIDKDLMIHVTRFQTRIGKFRDYYNTMRYGGKTDNPFVGFKDAVDIAKEMLSCDDISHPPGDLMEAFPCYDAESQFILFAILSRRVSDPYMKKFVDKTFTGQLDPEDDLRVENNDLNYLWTLGPIVIYDTFVKPLYLMLEDTIQREMKSNVMSTLFIAILMAIIVMIMTVIIILTVKELEKRVRYFLSLILHIDSKTILSTNKIMSILNGNILGTAIDASTRNTEFYDEVVDKLINGVIVVDEMNKIMSMNDLVVRTFADSEESYVGKDIGSLFNDRFDGDVDKIIDKNCMESALVTFGTDTYEIKKTASKQSVIINIKNETARINHSKLIAEERSKSDMMLSSILPAMLVPRVQAGEKNISFAVQSASVLFLDIVSFTPWCGSNKAAYIMKTLNTLFKELDRALQEFPMMTKVKCIGDCYMAAGGIFAEVNQPAVHAKQCVEFGLRAIEVVKKLDVDLGEQLQIRVGVNTGGPLVAGVIGTGKPTFEILGPTINMAQQMEHHGIPMAVHVSRATYELIYGGPFNIKERGQVEVKNGKVNTYVVTA